MIFATLVIFVVMLPTRWLTGQSTGSDGADNPNARPRVTEDDVLIVLRAQDILDSQSKWNRADTRVCQRMLRVSAYIALWGGPPQK